MGSDVGRWVQRLSCAIDGVSVRVLGVGDVPRWFIEGTAGAGAIGLLRWAQQGEWFLNR